MDVQMTAEVTRWLHRLREADPGTAGVVDKALAALRAQGTSLGSPLVVPVDARPGPVRPDLDRAYEQQLEMLAHMRKAVADIATSRKRLELQIQQLDQAIARLEARRARAHEADRDDLAADVEARLPVAAVQLAAARGRYAGLPSEGERVTLASQRRQGMVDTFRTRKEAVKVAEAAAEAAALAVEAEAAIEDAVAGAGGLGPPAIAAQADMGRAGGPATPSPLPLNELRPGAPGRASARILFTVESPATAILLAAGTERDWLDAWHAQAIARSRARYERDRGGTG